MSSFLCSSCKRRAQRPSVFKRKEVETRKQVEEKYDKV